MRLRRNRGFHGLKRPKLRQSWNKFNLYNLSRYEPPVKSTQTYFQQKWKSKSATRRYHGEQLGEKKWQRLFRPTIRSVVSMDPALLARGDGRQEARGRGSGLDRLPNQSARKPGVKPAEGAVGRTPYMHMAFAQLERRLDTAIFRAMFASSARQARQFCVHGAVKVNGQKMIYPGYQLNPGDMFQVDPERVLFATGAPKEREQRRLGRKLRTARKNGESEVEGSSKRKRQTSEDAAAESEAVESETPGDLKTKNRSVLQELLRTAQSAAKFDAKASASEKKDFRTFTKLVRSALSMTGGTGKGELPTTTAEQLTTLMDKLNITVEPPNAKGNKDDKQGRQTESTPAPGARNLRDAQGRVIPTVPLAETQMIKNYQRQQLEAALVAARDNPIDHAKPYATPWRPRPYMSAFAFIPRYLEVHHRICSAVYLRHPVARPGLAEVPTPFDGEMMGLSFNWYLRRR